jgi:hypothetical protein
MTMPQINPIIIEAISSVFHMPGDCQITLVVARRLLASHSETEREAILQGPADFDVQIQRAVARGKAQRAFQNPR